MGKIIYLDRSRIAERRTCARKRYLKYHALGHGLEQSGLVSLPLIHGNIFHQLAEQWFKAPSMLPSTGNGPFITSTYLDQLHAHAQAGGHKDFKALNLFNVGCAYLAATKHVFPQLLDGYEILDVEREFEWEIAPGMKLMMRMDLVLKNSETNTIKIIDWKTTSSSFGYGWGDRYKNSLQTLMYPAAAEAHYGLPCEGIQYVGVYVGKQQKFNDTQKHYSHLDGQMVLHSPYTVVYRSTGASTVASPPVCVSTKYKSGWTTKYVPMYNYTPEQYIGLLPALQLSEHFELGTSFLPSTEVMERVKRQVVWNETLFAEMVEEVNACADLTQRRVLTDLYFEMNDEACFAYNRQCEFTDMCFGNFTAADPLKNGFKQRTPHHAAEIELVKLAS